MANEAALRVKLVDPIDMTVADTGGIEKGALLRLVDPLTASGALVVDGAGAGIAAREKVSADGRTRLAVFREGIFDMYASGAITVGDPVAMQSHDNYIKTAAANESGARVLGHALETAATGEQIQVHLRVGG